MFRLIQLQNGGAIVIIPESQFGGFELPPSASFEIKKKKKRCNGFFIFRTFLDGSLRGISGMETTVISRIAKKYWDHFNGDIKNFFSNYAREINGRIERFNIFKQYNYEAPERKSSRKSNRKEKKNNTSIHLVQQEVTTGEILQQRVIDLELVAEDNQFIVNEFVGY